MSRSAFTNRQQRVTDKVSRYELLKDGQVLTCQQLLELWSEPDFVSYWTKMIVESGMKAVRWETPAWTASRLDKRFECVLIDSPSLRRRADQATYREYFSDTRAVAEFSNLAGDTTLVAPTPCSVDSDYAHLTAFLQNAPKSKVLALWRSVAELMGQLINEVPVWLSTAGGGVAWLHVRIDPSPKYYHYKPYKQHQN